MFYLDAESERKWTGREGLGVTELIQTEVQKEILLFSCYCEGPRRPVALTRGCPPIPVAQRPFGAGGHQMKTQSCPCYVYITLMLTCNLSAVAAWRHSLCVCTEVATCEFVQYMQVCVCLCPRRNLSVVTQKKQHVHAPSNNCPVHTYTAHTTHTQTHSSSCSPLSTLSWALPVTPHGDFALCQLSYSNKPLRRWSPRCVWLPQLIYIIYLWSHNNIKKTTAQWLPCTISAFYSYVNI